MRRPAKAKIAGLKRRPDTSAGYFDDLPEDQQGAAEMRLRQMLANRRRARKPVALVRE